MRPKFWAVWQKKKKLREYIKTVQDYADLIKDSRNPPFEMVDVLNLEMKDYEHLFAISPEQQNLIQISKVKKIIYHPNGEIDCFHIYKSPHKTIKLNSIDFLANVASLPTAKKTGISKEKYADYVKLIPYCSEEGQKCAKEILASTFVKQKEKKNKKRNRRQIFSKKRGKR